MKKTEILKQQYELTNDFNSEAMFSALKSQINDKVFKELINNEKHSLTVEFRVFVNEEETEDLDINLVNSMAIVKLAQKLDLSKLPKEDFSLYMDVFELWRKSGSIDTRKF